MDAHTKWPDSPWRRTATPHVPRPVLHEERQADICVVGAGFTGLSAALHAAVRGAQVVLLESEDVGWGASGRCAGQVIPGLEWDPDQIEAGFEGELGARMADFTGKSAERVFALIATHRIDCAAQRSGWICALHADAARPALEARAQQWQRRGADVGWLEGATLHRVLGTEAYHAGVSDRRGGKLQPLSYARGLALAAEARGASIYVRTRAKSLGRAGGGWRVLSEYGSVVAGQVLLCTNGYTDNLWPGLARSIVPAQSYQVATSPLGDDVRRAMLVHGQVVSDTRRLRRYFRLDESGRLIMGTHGGPDGTSGPRFAREAMRLISQTYRQVPDPDIEHVWSGKVALTEDRLPHLHELAPGVHAALGYNGHGVAMATSMGQVLADRSAGAELAGLPFPVTVPGRAPLHTFLRPLVRATGWWRKMADAIEAR